MVRISTSGTNCTLVLELKKLGSQMVRDKVTTFKVHQLDFFPRDLPGCKGMCGLMRILHSPDTTTIIKRFLEAPIAFEDREVTFCIKQVTEMTKTVVTRVNGVGWQANRASWLQTDVWNFLNQDMLTSPRWPVGQAPAAILPNE